MDNLDKQEYLISSMNITKFGSYDHIEEKEKKTKNKNGKIICSEALEPDLDSAPQLLVLKDITSQEETVKHYSCQKN